MALGRRSFLASTMAAVAAPAVLRLARADAPQFTLKLHHSMSAVSAAHDKFLAPWARKVEADSAGRIRIDIYPSMQYGGQPAQLLDQGRDGLVDIVWAAPSLTPGRFPKTELFELPFVPSRRALVSSKALEDFAAANLQDEFRDVHPICFSCTDRGILHTIQPIHTIEDVRGLRLHVQTRLTGEAVRALDARAVPMPDSQLSLAISQHVVDGCVDPWDMAPALKLYDPLKAHTDFAELSLSTRTFVLAMHRATYDRLPGDLKSVINTNSGQFAAGMAGTMWDVQAAMVADMVAQRGDVITTLQPAAVVHWRKATEPVIEAWLKQMKESKIDGGRLIAAARALLAKYVDEPEPQPPKPPQPAEAKAEDNSTATIESPAAPASPAVTPTPPAPPTPPTATFAPANPPLAPSTALAAPSAPMAPLTPAPSSVPPPPPAPPPAISAPAIVPLPHVAPPAPAAVVPPKTLDIPL